ncbi:uncharacterized protein F4807DRAFT_365397 [Annulohypoxylon truncatum]|uniref:uncharacterized protein n=1 Tax=Annulohypoxylon truncatum TaxID=327061 RepID=UPI00200743CA|nr:uncharacterized protein F4807DRAFT_365397 [Annulohypoxylon truncatum]KAI1212283.1 hypothetical protein F4807DRAFT_365397 [Annulohypoxylon truncatum]
MKTSTEIAEEFPAETSSLPQFVAIEKRNLEVLIRRANVRFTNECPESDSVVCLPKNEYDGFLQIQNQYANLVHNLLASGMPPEHVWNLAKDTAHSSACVSLGARTTLSPQIAHVPSQQKVISVLSDHERVDNAESNIAYPPSPTNTDSRSERHITSFNSIHTIEQKSNSNDHREYIYPLKAKRSVVLEGIPVGATCWDVTSAIRGGALVEFTMIAARRMAIVSFVSHESAARFFEHSKKRGFYVNNVKVPLRWSERQYTIPSYISNKAESGTTRNLVVKACRSRITEDRIRQDLEHIHRLVIINIDWIDDDCHIKTNSIQLAIYARTCMMSRSEYHGLQIGWDNDECDQPLTIPREDMLTKSWRPQLNGDITAPKIQNRFSTLEVEGNEYDD